MGIIHKQQRSNIMYWNAANGQFQHVQRHGANKVVNEYEGYCGVIDGVKIIDDHSDDFGDSKVLQISLVGTDVDGNEEKVVLCFRLIYGPRMDMVTVHGKMVLARLCNPANQIEPGIEVSISAYGGDKDKITMIKVQPGGEDPFGQGLPALDYETEPQALVNQVLGWTQQLINKFGTWYTKEEKENGNGNGSGAHYSQQDVSSSVDASHGAATAAMNALDKPANSSPSSGPTEKFNRLGIDPNYVLEFSISADKEKQWENKSPFLRHNGAILRTFNEEQRTKMIELLEANKVLPELVAVLNNLDLPF